MAWTIDGKEYTPEQMERIAPLREKVGEIQRDIENVDAMRADKIKEKARLEKQLVGIHSELTRMSLSLNNKILEQNNYLNQIQSIKDQSNG